VTNEGCPISAWFWQMWDSTALDRLLFLLQRIPKIHARFSRDVGHPSFIRESGNYSVLVLLGKDSGLHSLRGGMISPIV
jgi:hypothetical protein